MELIVSALWMVSSAFSARDDAPTSIVPKLTVVGDRVTCAWLAAVASKAMLATPRRTYTRKLEIAERCLFSLARALPLNREAAIVVFIVSPRGWFGWLSCQVLLQPARDWRRLVSARGAGYTRLP